MKVVIAIDPGKSGGVAVSAFGKTFCHPMPGTEGDRLELIRDFKRMSDVEGCECVCVLEQVGGFVGKGQPGSAMFKFGDGYGFLKGVVQTLGIKLVRVCPQVWQKVFSLGTAASCANSREWKNKLKAEAQRRFPDLNVTLKTADALLILEFYQLGAHGVTRPTKTISEVSGEAPDTARQARALPEQKPKQETTAVTDRTLQTKEQNT